MTQYWCIWTGNFTSLWKFQRNVSQSLWIWCILFWYG